MITGWATWRRAWQRVRLDMPGYEEFRQQKLIQGILPDHAQQRYWLKKFDQVHSGQLTTSWAIPWLYGVWQQRGLGIVPPAKSGTKTSASGRR